MLTMRLNKTMPRLLRKIPVSTLIFAGIVILATIIGAYTLNKKDQSFDQQSKASGEQTYTGKLVKTASVPECRTKTLLSIVVEPTVRSLDTTMDTSTSKQIAAAPRPLPSS